MLASDRLRAEPSRRQLAAAWLAVPFAVFLAVYAPAVGRGFISDDFRWIVESRIDRVADIPTIFSRHTGFYRPVVALTFAADYALFGNRPRGYGLTNLALALACAGLFAALLQSLGMPLPAALLGAALWLLNFHGIAMALLWISGRTALVLTAASLAAAIALVRGRIVIAALCLLIALFAKEEAVTLPVTLGCWMLVLGGRRYPGRVGRRFTLWIVLSFTALAIYLLLRAHSGALTPASAPPYYRFTFAPSVVARHFLQYADRSMTLPTAACLVAFLLLRPPPRPASLVELPASAKAPARFSEGGPLRSRPGVSWDLIGCGALWLAGGYALTMFLPIGSSLYACFPSIGACIMAADVCLALWRRAEPRARGRAAIAGVALVMALVPVYLARNQRWTELASFSSAVLDRLEALTSDVPERAAVVLLDERSQRVNLESTFGTLLDDAYALKTGRSVVLWVEPPLGNADLAGLRPPCAGCVAKTLQVRDGTLEAVR